MAVFTISFLYFAPCMHVPWNEVNSSYCAIFGAMNLHRNFESHWVWSDLERVTCVHFMPSQWFLDDSVLPIQLNNVKKVATNKTDICFTRNHQRILGFVVAQAFGYTFAFQTRFVSNDFWHLHHFCHLTRWRNTFKNTLWGVAHSLWKYTQCSYEMPKKKKLIWTASYGEWSH